VTKKELRQHLRGALAQISPEQLHQRSVQACTLLTSTQEFKRAQIIMVFLSLPNELDTTSLVLHAWQGMKRVLAPKVSWEQRRMLPIEIQSLSDDVSESPLGIREPAQGVPFPVANIDLVVVPGLGFDLNGNRIGRGRGFYDRFLAHRDWHGVACGLAFEDQVNEQVPTEALDMRVDMLVTDKAIRRFGDRAAVGSQKLTGQNPR
jgi:5-formyltetrahydrofolate cyclo-ligase